MGDKPSNRDGRNGGMAGWRDEMKNCGEMRD